MRNILWISILTFALLLSAASPAPVLAQEGPIDCGDTYTVQPRDYLSRIANLCGVSYAALINTNPQIENPNLIFPGQVINIPGQDGDGETPAIPVTGGSFYIARPGDTLSAIAERFDLSLDDLLEANPSYSRTSRLLAGERILLPQGAARVPTVSVTPGRASIGAPVTVGITGFRANTGILVGIGKEGGPYYLLSEATTDSNGALYRVFRIPEWVDLSGTEQHAFIAQNASDPNTRALSNRLDLRTGEQTELPGIPVTGPSQYEVQPGDTLSEIAAAFGTSLEQLLDANPDIEDPALIFTGQVLELPDDASPAGPWIGVSDRLVFPGQTIRVRAVNFPPNAYVDVRLAPLGKDFVAVIDAQIDDNGELLANITVPSTAQAGERWEAIVTTTERADISRATSLPIRIYE